MATAVVWKVGFACLVVVAVAVAAAPSSVSVHASEDQVAEMTVDAEGGARRELGARGVEKHVLETLKDADTSHSKDTASAMMQTTREEDGLLEIPDSPAIDQAIKADEDSGVSNRMARGVTQLLSAIPTELSKQNHNALHVGTAAMTRSAVLVGASASAKFLQIAQQLIQDVNCSKISGKQGLQKLQEEAMNGLLNEATDVAVDATRRVVKELRAGDKKLVRKTYSEVRTLESVKR